MTTSVVAVESPVATATPTPAPTITYDSGIEEYSVQELQTQISMVDATLTAIPVKMTKIAVMDTVRPGIVDGAATAMATLGVEPWRNIDPVCTRGSVRLESENGSGSGVVLREQLWVDGSGKTRRVVDVLSAKHVAFELIVNDVDKPNKDWKISFGPEGKFTFDDIEISNAYGLGGEGTDLALIEMELPIGQSTDPLGIQNLADLEKRLPGRDLYAVGYPDGFFNLQLMKMLDTNEPPRDLIYLNSNFFTNSVTPFETVPDPTMGLSIPFPGYSGGEICILVMGEDGVPNWKIGGVINGLRAYDTTLWAEDVNLLVIEEMERIMRQSDEGRAGKGWILVSTSP